MRYDNQTLRDQIVTLDGHEFIQCVFSRCDIVFNGSAPFGLSDCDFQDCRFSFGASAGVTLGALATLYGGGFKALVEDTFKNIAAGTIPATPLPAPSVAPTLIPQALQGHGCNWSYTFRL